MNARCCTKASRSENTHSWSQTCSILLLPILHALPPLSGSRYPLSWHTPHLHIYQRLFQFIFPSFCPHPTPHPVYALHETPDIFRRKPPRKITSRCWIRYPLRSHCIQISLIVPVQLYVFQSHSTGKDIVRYFQHVV